MSLWRPQGPPWNEIRRHDIKVHNCCYWIPLHFRDSEKEVAYILSSSPRIYWPQDKMDKRDRPWLPGPALLDAGSPWLSWCLAPGSCWPLCTLTVLLSDWTRRRNVLLFPFCKWGMEWYVRPRFWRYLQIFKPIQIAENHECFLQRRFKSGIFYLFGWFCSVSIFSCYF